jgi:hypothetical protein
MPTDINELSHILKVFLISKENQHRENILSMNSDQIAQSLSKIHHFLNRFIEYARNHNDVMDENKITDNQHTFLELFLSELYQNFFPMAHTQAPLKNLKIICNSIPDNDADRLRQQYLIFSEISNMLVNVSADYKNSVEQFLSDTEHVLDQMNIPIER